MLPRAWMGAFEEMIAPTPPRAKRRSQLTRTGVPGAVVVVEAPRHAGAQDAVPDGQRPERERLEDRLRGHYFTSAGRGAPS